MNSRAWMLATLTTLLVIGLGLSLAEAYRTSDWWAALLNLGPELIGAVVTYALFEVFLGRRMKEEEEKARLAKEIEEKKAQLTQELGSRVNGIAVAAAERLAQRGWLRDGSLRSVYLVEANLQGAPLWKADLQYARLEYANLRNAQLWDAKLQRALLTETDLQGAELINADLQQAYLRANLQGANLRGVNLRSADLIGSGLDEHTILPDGMPWTPDTEIAIFTDPDHPDFWRSDDPYSPAYRRTERE